MSEADQSQTLFERIKNLNKLNFNYKCVDSLFTECGNRKQSFTRTKNFFNGQSKVVKHDILLSPKNILSCYDQ